MDRKHLRTPIELATGNAMNNPYRMLENWPHLGDIKPGAAIGIVPDGKGGVWLGHRSVPAILHIDASGNIVKQFDVTFASSHGLCQDRDGNFWAADSGPFGDTPDAGVNSGFMMAQVTAASLASECKVLSHPASVDTIPTDGNKEDVVPMAMCSKRCPERP